MNALVVTLVVKASLLIATAAMADGLMRGRTSAASRHLLWTFATAGVLLLPVLATTMPAWGIQVHVAPSNPMSLETQGRAPLTTAEGVSDATALPAETFQQTPITASVTTEAGSSPVRAVTPWTTIALYVYAAGVAFLGLHLIAGRLSLRRLVRRSSEVTDRSWCDLLHYCESEMEVQQPVRLLRSLEGTMPMAFGIVRPTILIPAIADTWSDERRRAVLLHELAHIARRDCLTQLLAAIACGGYWMHPGVWWMARRLRVERELACDDRVLRTGTTARDYAAHLLELAYSLGGYRSPALVVSMARPRQLEGRMLAIMDAARNRLAPPVRAYAIGAAVMGALIAPLSSAEVVMVTDSPVQTAGAGRSWSSNAAPDSAPARSEDQAPPARVAPPAPPASVAPIAVPAPVREQRTREIQLPGTWEVRRSDDSARVYLQLSERANSMHGFTIPAGELDGLPPSLVAGGEGSAKFQLKRDAGTLVFDGVFRGGVGAGTYDFTPNPAFPSEMVKRGFESPNATEQYQLARGNIGFAYLDELNSQKYDRSNLTELVRAADHGVGLDYLREMGAAGYRLGQLGALVRVRDHGVTPAFGKALAAEGYKNLSVEDLVRTKDHGVSLEYLGTMRALGYKDLSLEALIRTRDHGVGADYIRAMAESGFQSLPLEDLLRARDHGVTSEFVKAMRDAGHGAVSLEDLVNARDHGISADYVHAMNSVGPERPSLLELINARDRGVGPDFAKAWRELGYPPVLTDLIRAREHGVGVEFIRELKVLGYDRMTVEDLIRLRDRGVSISFIREQNTGSAGRLTVDQLLKRRDVRW